jgi:hypothetical protein
MVQRDFPSESHRRKGQTFGSLQQAPQWPHWPVRLLETGNTAVTVLFIFADQVFRVSIAISSNVGDLTKTLVSQHAAKQTEQ